MPPVSFTMLEDLTMPTAKPLPPLMLPCPVCGAEPWQSCIDSRYEGKLGIHEERLPSGAIAGDEEDEE